MSVDNPHSVDAHNHNKASPVTHLVDSIGSFIISLTLVEFMPFIIIGDIVTLGVVSTKSPQIVSMFIRLTNVVTRRGLVKLSRGVTTWRGHVTCPLTVGLRVITCVVYLHAHAILSGPWPCGRGLGLHSLPWPLPPNQEQEYLDTPPPEMVNSEG